MKSFRTKVLGRDVSSSLEVPGMEIRKAAGLEARFYGHAGFPESTDSLAYDPIQRLLAVGTRDGRLKVVGREGVEHTFFPPVRSPTLFMQFLHNKGAIIRITREGDIQLWGIEQRGLLDSIRIREGPAITALVAFADQPYVLLGCDDGSVRVLSILSKDAEVARGVCPAHQLKELPYEVNKYDFGGIGPVVAMGLHSVGDSHRLLVIHKCSGAAVWDVRQEAAIAKTQVHEKDPATASVDGGSGDEGRDWQPATAGCWIGEGGSCFATGHANGEIMLWGIPDGDDLCMRAQAAVQLGRRHLAPDTGAGAPVRSLTYVPGSPAHLLVFGGQLIDQPDMLSLMTLHSSGAGSESEEVHTLPWFGAIQGFALVPPEGALTPMAAPAAIIVLTEGGQLMVHDLESLQPIPLSLPFQELAPVTTACFVASPTDASTHGNADQASREMHLLTLDRLRAANKAAARDVNIARASASRWRWVFGGGQPPRRTQPSAGVADIYLTGHHDGRVRVWDMTGNTPALLTTVPFDSGGAGPKPRCVTAVQVCVHSGVLVVAHDKGEVRVYQFADGPQALACVTLGPPPAVAVADSCAPRLQPPGFQCLLRAMLHSSPVQAICIASALGIVALGDAAGTLSLVDLTEPRALFVRCISQQSIVSLEIGAANTARRREMGGAASSQDSRLAVFVLLADSTVMVMDIEGGELVSRDAWLQPRHPEPAVALLLLDPRGAPVLPSAAALSLEWANNDAYTLPATGSEVGSRLAVSGSESEEAAGSRADRISGPLANRSVPSATEAVSARLGEPQSLQMTAEKSIARTSSSAELHAGEGDGHAVASLGGPSPYDVDSDSRVGGHDIDSEHGAGRVRERTKSLGSSDDEDSDNDDFLAAAAAAVDAQDHSKKKLGVFARIKSKTHHHQQQHHHVKSDEGKDVDASLHKHKAPSLGLRARKGIEGEGISLPTSLETSRRSDDGAVSGSPMAASASSQVGPTPALAPLLDPRGVKTSPPIGGFRARLASMESAECVAHILLVTRHHLRLYPADTLRLRERSSSKKLALDAPLAAAAAFRTAAGPALLAMSTKNELLVFGLPGLDLLQDLELEDVLGFPWGAETDAHPGDHLQGVVAASKDGQVVLVGTCGEVVRVALVTGTGQPTWPECLHDWDLSHAAAAASQALVATSASFPNRGHPLIKTTLPTLRDEAQEGLQSSGTGVGQETGKDIAKGGPAGYGLGLGGFLHQVRDAAKTMVDETVEGLPKLARHLNQGVDRFGRDILAARNPFGGADSAANLVTRSLPSLDAIFHGHVVEEGASPLSPGALAPGVSMRGREPTLHYVSMGSQPSVEAALPVLAVEEGRTLRPEVPLTAQASRPSDRPGPRTADEIKAAYGRPTKRAGELGQMMNETRAALEQRGERLGRLQDKTAAMEEEAASFASMAKQLRDREANRKWFHF